LRQRARGLVGILAERRRSLDRDRGQLLDAGVVATLEADAARLRAELEAVQAGLAQVEPDAAALAADEEAFQREREQVAEQLTIDDASTSLTSAASAAAEVRGELRSIRTGVERNESELRRASTRLDEVRAKLDELEHESERLRVECARAEEIESPLVAQIEQAERDRAEAEAELERCTIERHDLAEAA